MGVRTAFGLQFIAALLAALLSAGLAAAIVFAAIAGSLELMPLALVVALGHAVALGLPLFLAFRLKRWLSASSSIGAGFVVGVLPAGILAWPSQRGTGSAWIDGVATIIDGVPTAAGWLQYFEFLLLPGFLGASAGLVFWLVLKVVGVAAHSAHAGKDQQRARERGNVRATVCLAVAALLTGGVSAVPTITKDRTCHNMFRDGRSSIGPQVHFDLQIEVTDWPMLISLFSDFAVEHRLSFRNSSSQHPGFAHYLALSLCNDAGANIEAIAYVSATMPQTMDRGIGIGVFEVYPGSAWQGLARNFAADLEVRWPGRISFRDGMGRVIPVPDELR